MIEDIVKRFLDENVKIRDRLSALEEKVHLNELRSMGNAQNLDRKKKRIESLESENKKLNSIIRDYLLKEVNAIQFEDYKDFIWNLLKQLEGK